MGGLNPLRRGREGSCPSAEEAWACVLWEVAASVRHPSPPTSCWEGPHFSLSYAQSVTQGGQEASVYAPASFVGKLERKSAPPNGVGVWTVRVA